MAPFLPDLVVHVGPGGETGRPRDRYRLVPLDPLADLHLVGLVLGVLGKPLWLEEVHRVVAVGLIEVDDEGAGGEASFCDGKGRSGSPDLDALGEEPIDELNDAPTEASVRAERTRAAERKSRSRKRRASRPIPGRWLSRGPATLRTATK